MLRQLRVQNFRNHIDGTFMFSPTTTVIVGKNGTGKTSLLEAIYIGYRGSSFKGVDSDILRERAEWYRIDIHDDVERIVRYMADGTGRLKKTFEIDTKKNYRLPQKNKHPIVIFSPDDLQLLSGSPARRRKYLDTLISQLDPRYGPALRRYEQALLQRNKLLKSLHCTPDLIFPWNVILSEYGSYITHARSRVATLFDERLSHKYHAIAHRDDTFNVSYSHAAHTPQYLLTEYESHYDKDRILGATTNGPHRHDLIVEMNSKTAHDIASRGENRTIVLALKSIEAELLAELYGTLPLILLDDVYGELDDDRQKLIGTVFGSYQTIITSTHRLSSKNTAHIIKL